MTTRTAVTAACVCACLAIAAAGEDFSLPRHLADYRSWHLLTKQPVAVPRSLWMRCAPPTEEMWADAERLHGPHTRMFIRVHANKTAFPAFRAGRMSFPVGAMIAKEKLIEGEARPSAVAFMLKTDNDAFADSDGWQFRFYPSEAKDAAAIHQACTACHRTVINTDWVFGRYLKDEDRSQSPGRP